MILSDLRVTDLQLSSFFNHDNMLIIQIKLYPDVVACTCNQTALEAEFWNGAGSIPVELKST